MGWPVTIASGRLPRRGLSDVTGIDSQTMLRKTVNESRIVTPAVEEVSPYCLLMESVSPRESFSPESGGRVKPRTAMEAISTQGTIRLKK